MKPSERTVHLVPLKSQKQFQSFKKRQQRQLQSVPSILLGKLQSSRLQIYIQDLKPFPIPYLKQLNSNQKAFSYARSIIQACISLSTHYGFFFINQNMVFMNSNKQIFVWINPDLMENHIKIYLPRTGQGEASMMRSIVSYFKLWLKCDYGVLGEVKKLGELRDRFMEVKGRFGEGFRAKSPDREYMAGRKMSANFEGGEMFPRFQQGHQMLMDNKSTKQMGRSPQGRQIPMSPNNNGKTHYFPQTQGQKNSRTAPSDKQTPQMDHRSFNNNAVLTNKSIGIKNGSSLFPNKTTGKNHIVNMINKLDDNPSGYGKNKLLLEEDKMEEAQRMKLRKMKESLDGIGEELDGLFLSQMENQEEERGSIKQIQEEFNNLLG